jgi:LPS export ABC transporter protein LptC
MLYFFGIMSKYLNTRNFLVFFMIAIAGILLGLVIRNYQWFSPDDILESVPHDVDFSLQRLSYTETRDGVRSWTLVADSAAHTIGEEMTHIENIHMTFYDADDLGNVTMTARSGEIHTGRGEVMVRGNVVVNSPRGYTVYTEHLQYLDGDRLIRTEEPVRLVSETMEMTGKGMLLNVEEHTLVLLSEVQARIEGQGNGGLR